MRMPRLSPSAVFALLLAGTLALACKDSKNEGDPPPPPPPLCTLGQLGASCQAAGDCCSGNCANSICVLPVGQCKALTGSCGLSSECCQGACNSVECLDPNACGAKLNEACTLDTDCCQGVCSNGKCGLDDQGCHVLDEACSGDTQCCEGTVCTNSKCTVPTTAQCGVAGAACTGNTQCCFGSCVGGRCPSDGGVCDYAGERCTTDSECCTQNCLISGTCSATACRQITQSCTDNSQCCSNICTGGACQPIPAGSTGQTCKTRGEACTLDGDCCSTNCQAGVCKPAATCNAFGDVCARAEDCCAGMCAEGRCDDAPGGCGLDGYPCTADSNCCTKKCVDLGAGATVCQPSGGCRMTGNYCDSTASCCGGTNESDPSIFNTYGVYCDGPGTVSGAPQWDTRTQDSRTCSGGQSCNPPGNICGYKASQNCCHEGPGSGTQVCKPDENNILRCYGGWVDEPTCVETADKVCCPTGIDGNDPDCCIAAGAVCQFSDQCCGGTPCTPDASGVYRCAPRQCMPAGSICSVGAAPAVDPCCMGTTCQNIPELGWACASSTGPDCSREGQACGGANPACCFGACNSGTCGPPCSPVGATCSNNSQCCSASCSGGTCVEACQPEGATCTVTDDCCQDVPRTCELPYPSATSGTCKAGGISTCAETTAACVLDTDCCHPETDSCSSGICTPRAPPPTCSPTAGGCSVDTDCCQDRETLKCYTTDAVEQLVSCNGATGCFCSPPDVCIPSLADCKGGDVCCEANHACVQKVGGTNCTSTNPADCACKPVVG